VIPGGGGGGLAGSGDFDSTPLNYVFPSGSVSGQHVCAVIFINIDGVVENTEDFSVQLTASSEREDILITNGTASIFIEDSPFDCMLFNTFIARVGGFAYDVLECMISQLNETACTFGMTSAVTEIRHCMC
jgi:hypothetical protein